jgi:hypothetical protein
MVTMFTLIHRRRQSLHASFNWAVAGDDGLDIYSQVPPREPKYSLTCSFCNRQVRCARNTACRPTLLTQRLCL